MFPCLQKPSPVATSILEKSVKKYIEVSMPKKAFTAGNCLELKGNVSGIVKFPCLQKPLLLATGMTFTVTNPTAEQFPCLQKPSPLATADILAPSISRVRAMPSANRCNPACRQPYIPPFSTAKNLARQAAGGFSLSANRNGDSCLGRQGRQLAVCS